MHSRLTLASFILFAVGASAAASSADRFALFRRQAPIGPNTQIPAACTSTCSAIESTVNTCQDLTCLCTDSVAATIASCIDCLVAVGGGSVSQSQSLIDQYTNACITSGESISSIQVSSVAPASSGVASSGALTTVSGTGSATGSATPTATVPTGTQTTMAASSSTTPNGASRLGMPVAALAGAALFVVLV